MQACQQSTTEVRTSHGTYVVPENVVIEFDALPFGNGSFDNSGEWRKLDISSYIEIGAQHDIYVTLHSYGSAQLSGGQPAAYERREELSEPGFYKAYRKFESYKWDVLKGDTRIGACIVLNRSARCDYFGGEDVEMSGLILSLPDSLWDRRQQIASDAKALLESWRVK